jgi:hypothetical protein
LDFEQFLKELTLRIVLFNWFREALSLNKEEELTSHSWMFKEKVILILMISDILTSS